MRSTRRVVVVAGFIGVVGLIGRAQEPVTPVPAAARQDPNIKTLVDRLDLEKYKATIKGLTNFGDRRQGTDRNRDAVNWIEAQLKSYGCTNTERIKYSYNKYQLGRPGIPAGTTVDSTGAPVAAGARGAAGGGGRGGAGGRGAAG